MLDEYDLVALKLKLARWPKLLDQMPYEIPGAEGLMATDRGLILFATVHRAAKMCRAVLVLAEADFSQEISCLSRSLAELVVNGAYLQFAEDQEVVRYKNFDTVSKGRNLDNFLRFAKQLEREELKSSSAFSSVKRLIDEAKDAVGPSGPQSNWSTRDVASRALFSDYRLQKKVMQVVVAVAYQSGHSSVHSTWSSLVSSENASEDPRHIRSALFGVELCLSSLGQFISEKFLK